MAIFNSYVSLPEDSYHKSATHPIKIAILSHPVRKSAVTTRRPRLLSQASHDEPAVPKPEKAAPAAEVKGVGGGRWAVMQVTWYKYIYIQYTNRYINKYIYTRIQCIYYYPWYTIFVDPFCVSFVSMLYVDIYFLSYVSWYVFYFLIEYTIIKPRQVEF
jgi:hypothetical protein